MCSVQTLGSCKSCSIQLPSCMYVNLFSFLDGLQTFNILPQCEISISIYVQYRFRDTFVILRMFKLPKVVSHVQSPKSQGAPDVESIRLRSNVCLFQTTWNIQYVIKSQGLAVKIKYNLDSQPAQF